MPSTSGSLSTSDLGLVTISKHEFSGYRDHRLSTQQCVVLQQDHYMITQAPRTMQRLSVSSVSVACIASCNYPLVSSLLNRAYLQRICPVMCSMVSIGCLPFAHEAESSVLLCKCAAGYAEIIMLVCRLWIVLMNGVSWVFGTRGGTGPAPSCSASWRGSRGALASGQCATPPCGLVTCTLVRLSMIQMPRSPLLLCSLGWRSKKDTAANKH